MYLNIWLMCLIRVSFKQKRKYMSIKMLFVAVFFLEGCLSAQTNGFSVSRAPFSTAANDEFSPVYYLDGIVFCSNLRNNSLVTYKSSQGNMFNIFYIEGRETEKWKGPHLFSNEMTTNFNEGPVTFNGTGDTVYFCRNNTISGDKGLTGENKFGIYRAVKINGTWSDLEPFRYNDPYYSLVTPALSPDGNRLYFASDMPGGFGGSDLYYCERKNNEWNVPVNLGPEINTPKNESYPFACKSGKLFFSSEGLPGLGGKDLFYTQDINGKWISPVHLDSLINSPYNDYGIVTDEEFIKGFFSSDREKNDDIFKFNANPVAFPACDSMEKNNYCYLFYDEFRTGNDTTPVKYTWDFGNGIRKEGIKTKHCFPGPGQYSVKLIITSLSNPDSVINETPYDFELTDKEQVYIEAPDAALAGTVISMNGMKTNLQNFKISDFIWDLGEGYLTRGPTVSKVFNQVGEYKISLGVIGTKDTMNEVTKVCSFIKIKIFDDYRDLACYTAKEITLMDEFIEAENRFENNNEVSSVLLPDKKSNFIKQKTYLMNDLPLTCKDNIIKALCCSRESFIKMNDQEIDPESYPVLDHYVQILKENPGIRLYIALHTMQGNSSRSQEITDKWADSIHSYFLSKNITEKELSCKGYGSSRLKEAQNARESRDEKRAEFIFFKIQE